MKKKWLLIGMIVVVLIAAGIIIGLKMHQSEYVTPKVPAMVAWCGVDEPDMGNIKSFEKDSIAYIENDGGFVVKLGPNYKWAWSLWAKAGDEDVVITSATLDFYYEDTFVFQRGVTVIMDGGNLPAYGIWGTNALMPKQRCTSAVFVVKGKTASGKSFQATDRVTFE
jgi:hypothetical protein